MQNFRAIVVDRTDKGQTVSFRTLGESDLMDGDVTVRIAHSTVNFKDGLALTGKGADHPQVSAGTGRRFRGHSHAIHAFGIQERRQGDPQRLRRRGTASWRVCGTGSRSRRLARRASRERFTTSDAMTIGTAGFTAMLCALALSAQGVKPADGDVLVTGAAGGVGSMAVSILSRLGYRVVASTGRVNEEAYLKDIGADRRDRPHRVRHPGETVGQDALGGSGRQCRVGDARQCTFAGEVRRHGCRLRSGAGLRSSRLP